MLTMSNLPRSVEIRPDQSRSYEICLIISKCQSNCHNIKCQCFQSVWIRLAHRLYSDFQYFLEIVLNQIVIKADPYGLQKEDFVYREFLHFRRFAIVSKPMCKKYSLISGAREFVKSVLNNTFGKIFMVNLKSKFMNLYCIHACQPETLILWN